MKIINLHNIELVPRVNKKDASLLTNKSVYKKFGTGSDFAELHFFTNTGVYLKSDYDYRGYVPNKDLEVKEDGFIQSIDVDLEKDCVDNGITNGSFVLYYSFFRHIFSQIQDEFFINTISSDRTELVVKTIKLTESSVIDTLDKLIYDINSQSYVNNFVLNFGKNRVYLITNFYYRITDSGLELCIKLYDAISSDIDVKSTFSFLEEISDSNKFTIEIFDEIEAVKGISIKKPNFDLDIDEKLSITSDYKNRNALLNNAYTSSLYSYINDKSIELNIDYSDFSNFINFSSAKQRINNFIYKLELLESLESTLLYVNDISSSEQYISSNKDIIDSKIEDIKFNFDHYERFLYNESSSYSFPKQSNGKVYSITSSISTTWIGSDIERDVNYGGIMLSASYYDIDNKGGLIYSTPEYIRIDERNSGYDVFINMIAHHFDNLWVYIKDTTTLYQGFNNYKKGISSNIVVDVLSSFGVKLYDVKDDYDLVESIIQTDLNNDSEYPYTITNNDHINRDILKKEIYKRIYHNLPILLKSKGSYYGTKLLLNIFGIPDTMLRIFEYGYYDKDNSTLEDKRSIFNYALTISGSNRVYSNIISSSISNFSSFEFRFKETNSGSGNLVTFSPSGSVTGSMSVEYGNQDGIYSTVIFKLSGSSSSLNEIPIHQDKWFNFLIDRTVSGSILTHNLYIGWKDEYDVPIIKSASLSITSSYNWVNSRYVFGQTGSLTSPNGKIQEVRLWSEYLNTQSLKNHILNPLSIRGNLTSSYNSVLVRNHLGTNVYKHNHYLTSSMDNLNFQNYTNDYNYSYNYEDIYLDSPSIAGFKVNNTKISIDSSSIEDGVLSAYIPTVKKEEIKSKYNYNTYQIGLSPSDEIDFDIISKLGHFNVEDIIGNPAYYYSSSYDELRVISDDYFTEYISKYNYQDYIRILKWFNNSLFKTLKDFSVAKSTLSTGFIYKPHILERIKMDNARVSFTENRIYNINLGGTSFEHNSSSLYSILTTNKVESFNGNISGSVLLMGDKARVLNTNPYLTEIKPNYNLFPKSDWDVMRNNFNKNRYSYFRKNHENAGGVTVSSSAQVEDYIEYNTSSNRARYDGCKVTIKTLNEFNVGDINYDKNPTIKSNVNQVGVFTEITKNVLLPELSQIHIKYLVDKKGNITSLNSRNKNWFDIQNTFKDGDDLIISLFDNQKYGNQSNVDGTKPIYNSGYRYATSLYFSEDDRLLTFNINSAKNQNKTVREVNNFFWAYEPSSRDISKKAIIYNLYPSIKIDDNDNYVVGSELTKTFSSFTIPSTGQYTFNAKLSLKIKLKKRDSIARYTLGIYKNSPLDVNSLLQSETLEFVNNKTTDYYDFITTNTNSSGWNYLFSSYWGVNENASLSIPFNISAIWTKSQTGLDSIGSWAIFSNQYGYSTPKIYEVNGNYRDIVGYVSTKTLDFRLPFDATTNINLNLGSDFKKGEKVYFILSEDVLSETEIDTVRIISGEVNVNINGKILDPETKDLIVSMSGNSVVINGNLSYHSNIESLFNPTNSTLYKKYGDIESNFSLEVGDYIRFFNKNTNEYNVHQITSVTKATGVSAYIDLYFPEITLGVTPPLLDSLTADSYSEVLFYRRLKDETVVMLNYNISDLNTSYGLVIPQNISEETMNNIDQIIKELKTKLINENNINITPN